MEQYFDEKQIMDTSGCLPGRMSTVEAPIVRTKHSADSIYRRAVSDQVDKP